VEYGPLHEKIRTNQTKLRARQWPVELRPEASKRHSLEWGAAIDSRSALVVDPVSAIHFLQPAARHRFAGETSFLLVEVELARFPRVVLSVGGAEASVRSYEVALQLPQQ